MSVNNYDIELFIIMKETDFIRVSVIWFSAWSATILLLKLRFFFNCKLFWIHLWIILCISSIFWLANNWTEFLIQIHEQDRKCRCKNDQNRKNAVHTNYFNKYKKFVSNDRNHNLFIFVETEIIMKHIFISIFNNFHIIQ